MHINKEDYLRLSHQCGFDRKIHAEVLRFYARDVTPRQCLEKGVQIQKSSLKDYLSNLYLRVKTEQPNLKLSFATFAKLRPSNYVRSGKLYEPVILSVHETPKRRPKTKVAEKLRQNCPDQS